jgi:LysR family transcriptional regulator for bpeEF and oprC
MDKLKAMQVFNAVVQRGSFSAAAQQLNLANSAVSRHVSDLERWLGARLLYRTTRKLSLTQEGNVLLQKLQGILDSVGDLEQSADNSQSQVRGRLRITAPVYYGRHLFGPLLPGFLQDHPEVEVSLLLVDRYVDMVQEGYDLAIRVGELPDSSLIARPLDSVQLKTVASPSYLRKSGHPLQPSDLRDHLCLLDGVEGQQYRWLFREGNRNANVLVGGRLVANNGELIRDMAIAGSGVAHLPDIFVRHAIECGDLVALLEEFEHPALPVSVVYPYNRYPSLALRTLIDVLSGKPET